MGTAEIHLDRRRKANRDNSQFFLSVRILTIDEQTLGFPFQMDYGQVNKLHLNDDWVSNGLHMALQKHYKNKYKINIFAYCPKTMVEAGFLSNLTYSQGQYSPAMLVAPSKCSFGLTPTDISVNVAILGVQ